MATGSGEGQRPAARRALYLAGLCAVLTGGATIVWYWLDGLPYDATSGVWMALAHDWSRGVLYRPLFGEDGFGGTRYMPLFFVMLGSLVRAGLPILTAGVALTIASLVALLTGIAWVVRRKGAGESESTAIAGLMLASITVQLLGIAVKGDLMATALTVWGLSFALALRPGARNRLQMMTFIIVVLLFTLAFAVKVTAVSGAAAVVAWLAMQRRYGPALAFGAAMFAGAAAAVAATQLASHGMMMTTFRAVADGGGSAGYLARAPWWMLRAAARDPFLLAMATCGIVLAIRRVQRSGHDLLTVWLGVTIIEAVVIFGSPGTDSNHLIDLLAASVIMIGLEVTSHPPRRAHAALVVFAIAVLVTCVPGVPSVANFFRHSGRPTRSGFTEMRAMLGKTAERPIMSENPLVPILLGQTPEVSDPFSLRLLAQRDSEIAVEFDRRLSSGYYGAVVLMDWSGSDAATVRRAIDMHTSEGVTQFYGEMNFPAGFLATLWKHYRVRSVPHPFVILEVSP